MFLVISRLLDKRVLVNFSGGDYEDWCKNSRRSDSLPTSTRCQRMSTCPACKEEGERASTSIYPPLFRSASWRCACVCGWASDRVTGKRYDMF